MTNRKFAFLLSITLLAAPAVGYAEKKVTVCHVPPDSPGDRQTISVGEAAVRAHLAHGDQLGACATLCQGSCDDGNACTSDSCDANGQCRHETVNCDDGNPCTRDDFCDTERGCLPLPNDGLACDDQNDCTSADACAGTECRGTAIAGCCATDVDCDDQDPCTLDSCAAGACSNSQKDCSVPDKCLAGFCNEGICYTTERSCDDSNVCTDDLCDPAIGCSNPATTNPPEPTEVSCADSADNDCDGLTDGADPNCCDIDVNPECAPQSQD